MPSSNKFAEASSCVLLTLAILCGLYCLFITGAIINQWDGPGFATIDYMVAAEGEVADPTKSPSYYLRWVVGLSLIGAAFSILGCIGSCECMDNNARQPCLSTFFCSMLALSVFFMVVYTSTVEFNDTMVPVLTRQMDTMTSASVLPIFSSRLNCPVSGAISLPGQIPEAEQPACGPDCEARLALVSTMANRTALNTAYDSCAFLHELNTAYVYESKGAGKCQVTPAPAVTTATASVAAASTGPAVTVATAPALPPMYTFSAASLDACKDACTAWTACAGVSFNPDMSCLLVSSSDPDGALAAYARDSTTGVTTQLITPISGADATAAFECYAKSIPVVLQTMTERNNVLSYLTLIGAVVTLVSALLSAVITFTVATKMQGKKGIHMVCLRMYCGCCFTPSDKVRVASKTDGDEEMQPLAGY